MQLLVLENVVCEKSDRVTYQKGTVKTVAPF